MNLDVVCMYESVDVSGWGCVSGLCLCVYV